METLIKLIVILLLTTFSLLVILFFVIFLLRKRPTKDEPTEMEAGFETKQIGDAETEELIRFQCGEDLTVHDILDAPGEVIGKSSYGTLYRASLFRVNSVVVLRFLRPACTGGMKEVVPLIQVLGSIRHDNLVPLKVFYGGPGGEKLLVHPFYGRGNLAQFIRDGNGDSIRWDIIGKISIGIVRGLDHLHSGLQKPIIHGNLKSKNIFLDRNYHPYISDFGIHLLLNPTSGQEMLDVSASQGYKAPELITMRDANEETDIYSLGVILLELLTGKEPINENPTLDEDFFHLAMTCCSPSPSLRPHIKQVLGKLEEILGGDTLS